MKFKTYYHVTNVSKLPTIKRNGLNKNLKNVRISKNVNYVMDSLYEAGSFASQMRYETEEDVAILHLRLDSSKIYQDNNSGAIGSWKEYHGNIPPSAITKVTKVDKKFWIAHQKRAKKIFGR